MNTDLIKKILLFPFVRPNTYPGALVFIILWSVVAWIILLTVRGALDAGFPLYLAEFFMSFNISISVFRLTNVNPPLSALVMSLAWIATYFLFSAIFHVLFAEAGSKAPFVRTLGVIAITIPLKLPFLFIGSFFIPMMAGNGELALFLQLASSLACTIVTAFIMYKALLEVHGLGPDKTRLIVAAGAIVSSISILIFVPSLYFFKESGGFV